MIILHSQKGGIVAQVLKNLHGEDVRLLTSNINRVEGSQWQGVLKCRKTSRSFPAEYQFILGIFDAFQKEPYFIEMSEAEVRQKLKSWGFTASEADALINSQIEEK